MNVPHRLCLAVAPVLACAALTVVGCGRSEVDSPSVPKALAQPVVRGPSTSSDLVPPPAQCRGDARWSCVQQQRFAAASAYINRNVSGKGYLSVVFTDRQTGHAWRYGPTRHEGWTASTVKLAIATDLLRRQRAGQIALTAGDRHDMATMLNFSD